MTTYVRDLAKRGAALLDRIEPGWEDKINLSTLTMSSCYLCILGQIYGAFYTMPPGIKKEECDKLGFVANLTTLEEMNINLFDFWNQLAEEWKKAILLRRDLKKIQYIPNKEIYEYIIKEAKT
jgi:hypothetical protein